MDLPEQNNTNDLIDLTDERVDALSALITVSAEQLNDRLKVEKLLGESGNRTDELIEAVFGSANPSIESYLKAREEELQAA